ncbi:winged helix-turn-helix domain-containing protein [Actinosynnema sp. NPDC053489]|uniref:winged helix-turn-helix domain-containing protein n=1 Tax=Actinosynnema sp. NPDC053489 TaxID=3363916 RepID=UPI0037C5F7BD
MRHPDGGDLTAKQCAWREQVRFEAAELFAQDGGPPQVARLLRVSRKSAYAWHARWRAGGVEALCSEGPCGRRSRMRPQWRDWPAAELDKGPAAHGWDEEQGWTLARVALVIARRFHVRFSPAQTWRVLRQMGFTPQLPTHRSAERDEHRVATWVRKTWPQVGKE